MRTYLAVIFAVLVGVAFAREGGSQASVQGNYNNEEAREVASALNEYLGNIYIALEEYLQSISTTCSAAVSLQEYKTAVTYAKNSACSTKTPDGYKGAEATIVQAAAKCKEADTAEDLEMLMSEIGKALIQVQHNDKLLSENTKFCSLRKLDKHTCDGNRKQIVSQLKNILSNKETARFQQLLRKAFFNTKKIVDRCMDSTTKSLKKNLDGATKKINDCLHKW